MQRGIDENSPEFSHFLGFLRKAMSAANRGNAGCIVHRHGGKGGEKKVSAEVGRGSSAIDGKLSAQWVLERAEADDGSVSVDWKCSRANDVDRTAPRPFNMSYEDGKFQVRDETSKQVKAAARSEQREGAAEHKMQLARSELLEKGYQRLAASGAPFVSFPLRDAETICTAKRLGRDIARTALQALVADDLDKPPTSERWFQRERGRFFFGIDTSAAR